MTKLYRPSLRSNIVSRARLLAELDAGMQRPLILVCAPAGFGKTTLLLDWLRRLEKEASGSNGGQTVPAGPDQATASHIGWLSLNQGDNDLFRFFTYLAAALAQVDGYLGETAQKLLQSPNPLPPDTLMTALINDVVSFGQPILLVLDDYHLIKTAEIHQALTFLLDHMPPHLHLIVTSRTDPPLPLSRLRGRNALLEIRPDALRFSVAEAATFFQQAMALELSPEDVAELDKRAEGWIAGLQMAALSMQGAHDTADFVRRFSGNHRYILDYLSDEVLNQQPAASQYFLLRSAILERLNGALCDAVLYPEQGQQSGDAPAGISPSQRMLERLETNNLFIIPLDDERRWYRYHHLFADLLRRKLQALVPADEIAALHRRAGVWLAEQGALEVAIEHGLAAGDTLWAAQLVEQNRYRLMNQDDSHTLERCLAMLPDDLVGQRPALLLARAWVLQVRFYLRALPPILEAVATLLGQERPALDQTTKPALQGELNYMWGFIGYWQGQGQRALPRLQQAVAELPKTFSFGRGMATFYLSLVRQMIGQREAAVRMIGEALYGDQRSAILTSRLRAGLMFIHLLSGELLEGAQQVQQTLGLVTKANLINTIAWGHYLLGCIHYQRNDLPAAAHYFEQAVAERHNLQTRAAIDSLVGLALTYQAMQRPDKAQETMELLLAFALPLPDPLYLTIARSCQARLALLQGDVVAATRWLQGADLSSDGGTMVFFLEIPRLTRCRVLIARGSRASLEEASQHLADHLQEIERTHNTWQMIGILLLQALADQGRGAREAALAAVERAIRLARPGGFIRPFVDLGPPLAGLLYQLAEAGLETDYIGQLLAAFPQTEGASLPARQIRQASQAQLIEPLTRRESDVLRLLNEELPNKAIARRLSISPLTVKRHTINIYQKLGVSSRQEAVSAARALGILPADSTGSRH